MNATLDEKPAMTDEYCELRIKWQIALNRVTEVENTATVEAEAAAYAALIDYVETHGLNYGSLDPRDWSL